MRDVVCWENRELYSMNSMCMKQVVVLTLLSTGAVSVVFAEEELSENTPEQKYFHVEQEILDDGKTVEKAMIVGPPSPPSGYEQGPVVPECDQDCADSTSTINNVSKGEK